MTDTQPSVIPIYTVGYGSRTIDDFAAVLRQYDIVYLIDIRSVPFSRYKPEFSKKPLENYLRAHGFQYVYMGDLLGGQPADRSCYVDDKVVYELVSQKPFYREGLARLQSAHRQGLHVVLMCSEGKPAACHRSKLIGASLAELGIHVVHIDEEGRPRSQGDVTFELTDGQLSLFDDNSFTSRKRYRRPEDEDDS